MIGLIPVLLVISAALLETLSQFTARIYWENQNKLYLLMTAWAVYFGVVAILVLLYDYSKVAISNSLFDAMSIVFVSLIGYFYFGEPMGAGEIIGICLVIIGALTIGFTTEDKDEVI